MTTQQTSKFTISFIGLTFFYYLLKFYSHLFPFIPANYHNPISSLIAGGIFSCVVLYLGPLSNRKFYAFTFLYLVLTKFEILLTPPYGDTLVGSWAEGYWLAQNNFNYAQLLQELEFNKGGPKVYVFSLYPGFIALLMKLIKHTGSFLFINHWIVFLLATSVVSQFRSILERQFSKVTSSLLAICLLSLPLFQSHCELLNMEIFILFFGITSIHYFIRKKYFLSCLFASLAAFTKGTGIIICGVIFTGIFFDFFTSDKKKLKYLLYALLPIITTLLVLYFKKLITTNSLANNQEGLFVGLKIVGYSTFLIYSSTISIVLTFIFSLKKSLEIKRINFIFVLVCIMWFALFINFPVMIPRYKLLLAPFLIYLIFFSIQSVIKKEKILLPLLICSILFANLASYGLLYKPVAPEFRFFIHNERTLEYRDDLALFQKIIHEIDKTYPNYTVGAPPVMAQAIGIPEFGYVKNQRDIILYGMNIHYSDIRNYPGLNNFNYKKTIWIALEQGTKKNPNYPIDKKDHIVKEIISGDNKAILFLGGVAIEKKYRAVLNNFLLSK